MSTRSPNPVPIEQRNTLSIQDAAHFLNCSYEYTRRLLESGVMPTYRLGRRVYVRRADLDRYVASITTHGPSAA